MKTKGLLIGTVFISMVFLVGACHKNSDNVGNTMNNVSISSTGYSPASLTIATGASVTWTNKDSMVHTVTTADGSISSGDIAAGATFSKTFEAAGTFNYYDAHNTSMTGVLTVTKPSGGGY